MVPIVQPNVELTSTRFDAFCAILPRASPRYQWSTQRPLNAQIPNQPDLVDCY